jgi:hypothetical protein
MILSIRVQFPNERPRWISVKENKVDLVRRKYDCKTWTNYYEAFDVFDETRRALAGYGCGISIEESGVAIC